MKLNVFGWSVEFGWRHLLLYLLSLAAVIAIGVAFGFLFPLPTPSGDPLQLVFFQILDVFTFAFYKAPLLIALGVFFGAGLFKVEKDVSLFRSAALFHISIVSLVFLLLVLFLLVFILLVAVNGPTDSTARLMAYIISLPSGGLYDAFHSMFNFVYYAVGMLLVGVIGTLCLYLWLQLFLSHDRKKLNKIVGKATVLIFVAFLFSLPGSWLLFEMMKLPSDTTVVLGYLMDSLRSIALYLVGLSLLVFPLLYYFNRNINRVFYAFALVFLINSSVSFVYIALIPGGLALAIAMVNFLRNVAVLVMLKVLSRN
jgi:hypothetical protein